MRHARPSLVGLYLVGMAGAAGCTLDAVGEAGPSDEAMVDVATEAASTTSGVGTGGVGGGGAPECTIDDECSSGSLCAVARCAQGACVAEPAPEGLECRAASGGCATSELCDGVSLDCPLDVVLPLGTPCRATMGDCDVPESCDGTSPECPADVLVSAGTVCRAAAGACDVDDACDGSTPTCPADALAASTDTCRPSVGACDVAEQCNGSSIECPGDTGITATCTPALPVPWNAFERSYKVTSVTIAGVAQTSSVVAAGASTSVTIAGTWQRSSNATCPGCVTQLYFAMNGRFTACVDTSASSGSFSKTINFIAPSSPGVYVINPEGSWQYGCLSSVATGTSFTPKTVATIVVQ